MPIKRCTVKGKSGFQWGSQKCYIGKGARAKAGKQAAAIKASQARKLKKRIRRKPA